MVGAAAAVFLLLQAACRIHQQLAAPVQVWWAEEPPVVVPAGETVKLPAPFGQTLVAEWELVRPISADSAPMGETMHGSTVVRSPRGVGARGGDDAAGMRPTYFAPLITNATSQPLRVMVNAGLEGAMDCGCAVRPGGQRVFIGYYRLYQNSTVQVRGSSGATATFTELGPQVMAADGYGGTAIRGQGPAGARRRRRADQSRSRLARSTLPGSPPRSRSARAPRPPPPRYGGAAPAPAARRGPPPPGPSPVARDADQPHPAIPPAHFLERHPE